MAKFMHGVPLKLQHQCKGCGVFTFKFMLTEAALCSVCVQNSRNSAAGDVQNRKVLDVPCQNSNNCAEGAIVESEKFELSSQGKKSTAALEMNVEAFCNYYPINNIGFLTLTFADDIQCPKEAQKRFKSFYKYCLHKYFGDYIRCYERQENGRIHYHLILDCKVDILTGFDFKQFYNKKLPRYGRYKSANKALKAIWKLLRDSMEKYGFGRHELLPIRTCSARLAKYVGKYISKHVQARIAEDKNVRLVQCSQDSGHSWKVANSNFSFFSYGSTLWRKKLQTYIETNQDQWNRVQQAFGMVNTITLNADNYSEMMCFMVGSSWGYKCRDIVLSQEI